MFHFFLLIIKACLLAFLLRFCDKNLIMKINIYVLSRNIDKLNAANVVNGTDNNVVL